MREHLDQLAAELRVRIQPVETSAEADAVGIGKQWVITAPAIRSRASYFVALHELGHTQTHDPVTMLGYDFHNSDRMEAEVYAGAWALEHAIVEPGPRAWRELRAALLSHLWAVLGRPKRRTERWEATAWTGAVHEMHDRDRYERGWVKLMGDYDWPELRPQTVARLHTLERRTDWYDGAYRALAERNERGAE